MVKVIFGYLHAIMKMKSMIFASLIG